MLGGAQAASDHLQWLSAGTELTEQCAAPCPSGWVQTLHVQFAPMKGFLVTPLPTVGYLHAQGILLTWERMVIER